MTKEDVLKLMKKAEKDLTGSPTGSLYVKTNHGQVQYYQYLPGNKLQYISKKKINLINLLAQKKYAQQIMNKGKQQLKILEKFEKATDENWAQDIYSEFPDNLKKHISPYEYPDEEFLKIWTSTSWEMNKHEFGENVYYTLKGERVRSKSEVIIADRLTAHNIPYRYEYPLFKTNIYPDFTILNVKTRKTVIWEHFGMMDNPSYRKEFFNKINLYASIGLIAGKNLILSFEDSLNPMSTRYVDTVIESWFGNQRKEPMAFIKFS